MIYQVSIYPWTDGYEPRAEATLTQCETGLNLVLTCWEREVIGTETVIGGAVSRDSCLEFFFKPTPETDQRYINIEVNATACAHIGIGEGRHGRKVLTGLPSGFKPITTITAGEKWSVSYTVPHEFIKSHFPDYEYMPGRTIYGNFYCCDESIHPHFGCWSPIDAPKPDFHRPECFGAIKLN